MLFQMELNFLNNRDFLLKKKYQLGKEMGHNKGMKILNWAIDVQGDRQFEIDTEICGIIWE